MEPTEVDEFIEIIKDQFKEEVITKAFMPTPIGFDYTGIKYKLGKGIDYRQTMDYESFL